MRLKRWLPIFLLAVLILAFTQPASAQGTFPLPRIGVEVRPADPKEAATSLQILILLTVLTLAPAILILFTSFTRIVIVLALVRNALGVQQIPPNQVIVGLALFLTLFTMAPTFGTINQNALQPYLGGKITQPQALERAAAPLRQFMLRQTREKDLALFISLAREKKPRTTDDIPTYVVLPAFVISELRTAFILGALIFVPFLVIDLVVSSTLMSMGMLMLPPIMISLPFKLLLFVMVDGWHLVARALILSFR